ncbi:hypothetical protein SLOPH_564, partial [Spraguea lophii 42_110]
NIKYDLITFSIEGRIEKNNKYLTILESIPITIKIEDKIYIGILLDNFIPQFKGISTFLKYYLVLKYFKNKNVEISEHQINIDYMFNMKKYILENKIIIQEKDIIYSNTIKTSTADNSNLEYNNRKNRNITINKELVFVINYPSIFNNDNYILLYFNVNQNIIDFKDKLNINISILTIEKDEYEENKVYIMLYNEYCNNVICKKINLDIEPIITFNSDILEIKNYLIITINGTKVKMEICVL